MTQSVGLIYQAGIVNHFRASLDFLNTVTSGEQVYLSTNSVVDLESVFPSRVIRAPAAPGDPYGVGPITQVLTGNFNLAWRHSYEWSGLARLCLDRLSPGGHSISTDAWYIFSDTT